MTPTLETFIANLRRAIRNREDNQISAGTFNNQELAEAVLVALEGPQWLPMTKTLPLADCELYWVVLDPVLFPGLPPVVGRWFHQQACFMLMGGTMRSAGRSNVTYVMPYIIPALPSA